MAQAIEGSTSEAISGFNKVKGSAGFEFAGWAGLAYALERGGAGKDNERLEECRAHLVVDLDSASDRGLFCAATLALWTGDFKSAKEFIKKLRKVNAGFPGQAALRGWWELLTGQTKADFFEEFSGPAVKRDLEAQVIKAKYFQMRNALKESLEVYNQIVVDFPAFAPALALKASAFVALGDWTQALETAQRALAADSSDIEALLVTVNYTLAVDCNFSRAHDQLNALFEVVRRTEPRSVKILSHIAKSVARLASRNKDILETTIRMIEAAAKIDPQDASLWVEHGYQKTLLGDIPAAQSSFERAARIDETNSDAIYGTISCQLAADQLDDAEQQLDFLGQINSSAEKPPMVSFMAADLASRKRLGKEKVVALLDEAVAAHMAAAKRIAYDTDVIVATNPEFLLSVARLYIQQVSLDPQDLNDATRAVLSKAIDVLNTIKARVPSHIASLLLLGRAKYAQGDRSEGLKLINHCSELDQRNPDIHISLAQIYSAQGNTGLALASLEQALAYDFAIRDLPLYELIRAQVLEEQGNLAETLRVLQHAMACPGVRQPAKPEQLAKHKFANVPLDVRATIFINLARVHAKLSQVFESAKVMNDAMMEFKGTTEEKRVAIANCEVALEKGDIEAALQILNNVDKADSYYIKSRTTMARIYLQHRADRRTYADIYISLMKEIPTTATFTMAAEAFMRISEPEKAIKAYEAAIRLSPNDAQLVAKIGKVLVSTHDYKKAIDFYKNGIKNDNANMVLRKDLADLYLKLKMYEDSQSLLVESIKMHTRNENPDVISAIEEVAMLVLLAEVTKQVGKVSMAGDLLARANTRQVALITRVRTEKPELVEEQRRVAAQLSIKLAEFQSIHRGQAGTNDDAIKSYNDALRFNENNTEALLALAKLALSQNNLDLCQEHCLTLLRSDPANEEATMLLADVMFARNEHTTAIYHFEQLLEKTPSNYKALSRLLVLLRRAGKLQEYGAKYLSQAEASAPKVAQEPGFNFCKGLYSRYSSDPMAALKFMNNARKDPEWGEQALRHMIEIYLMTDDKDLWEEAEEGLVDARDRLVSAESLLIEFPNQNSVLFMWLQGQVLLASKEERKYDIALELFTKMVTDDRDSVPGLLGLAITNQLKKDSAKARNHLKRLSKMEYNPEFADEFEKAYLLLADLYIDGGKIDQAIALIRSCLSHNMSCSKAWEYQGKIHEKEQAYKDAADSYERAWRFEQGRSTSIGYKLAFNYLKASRHVEAIDICHKVLELDPKFPKIKKEIMDKARALVRA